MNKEEREKELINTASNNINEGKVDSFRSYDEGVKDALEWVYYNSNEPELSDDLEN